MYRRWRGNVVNCCCICCCCCCWMMVYCTKAAASPVRMLTDVGATAGLRVAVMIRKQQPPPRRGGEEAATASNRSGAPSIVSQTRERKRRKKTNELWRRAGVFRPPCPELLLVLLIFSFVLSLSCRCCCSFKPIAVPSLLSLNIFVRSLSSPSFSFLFLLASVCFYQCVYKNVCPSLHSPAPTPTSLPGNRSLLARAHPTPPPALRPAIRK